MHGHMHIIAAVQLMVGISNLLEPGQNNL